MVTVGIHTVARAIVAQHHHLTQRRRCGVFEVQVAGATATVIQSKRDFAGRYRIYTTGYSVGYGTHPVAQWQSAEGDCWKPRSSSPLSPAPPLWS